MGLGVPRFGSANERINLLAIRSGMGIVYSKYGFLKRVVMRRMAQEKGLSTDTSRDHDYTDWEHLCDFVRDFLDARCPQGQELQPA